MNLTPGQLPLLKSMHIQYKKMSKGDLTAVATLTEEQRALMASAPRGEVTVGVVVKDSIAGVEPVVCEMVWAWIPRPPAKKDDSGSETSKAKL